MKKTIFLVCLLVGLVTANTTMANVLTNGEVITDLNNLPKINNRDFTLAFDLSSFYVPKDTGIAFKFSVQCPTDDGNFVQDESYEFHTVLVYNANEGKGWGARYYYGFGVPTEDCEYPSIPPYSEGTIVMHHEASDDSNQATITYSILQKDATTGVASLNTLASADGKYFGDSLKNLYHENSVWKVFSVAGTISNVRMWDSIVSAETITSPSIPSDAVPEPTTATLSLLALAGLCARRRR